MAFDELLSSLDGPVYYLSRGLGTSSDLRFGDRGSPVMAVQEQLLHAGFYGAAPDGLYGPATEEAVRSLQREFGIDEDGAVGVETRLVLGKLSDRKVPTLDNPDL